MNRFISFLFALFAFAAQAQTVVTMGPGTGPGGAIECQSFGCTNVPNSAGLPLSLGYSGSTQNIAVLFNGNVWNAVQLVPYTQGANGIATRVYDVLLTSPNGSTVRLQMTTVAHAARCSIRVSTGCLYYRIQPSPVPTLTFN